jgi:hypothetical protein
MYAWQADLVTPPQHIWNDPDFATLADLTAIHQLLINDMYSYRREVKWEGREDVQSVLADVMESESSRVKGYSVFNAVCALLQQDGIDETNVMERLKEYIYRNELEFKGMVEKLRSGYKDDANDLEVINSWVTFLTDNIAGNSVWSSLCRRYNSI